MRYNVGLEKFEDPKSHNAALAAEYANNYTEYTVAQKAEGKNLIRRLLLIALYAVCSLAYAIVFLSVIKIPMLVALLPVTLWMLIFFTWRFVSVEHEYMLASGVMTFVDIYGGRKRRALFACPVKEMREIAPLCAAAQPNAENVIDMRGSAKSPDSYYFVINDRDGAATAVLFEATNKAVQILKYYNSATVPSDSLSK